ncbi:HET-domain-containing protein [Hyaloscypha bicolor E]|uniref:HET-domain-containing protein n=1 Tax=Hyaloscypha bicolor E TaxID=1095630 RepID=A0A2J6SVJ4_9HELO|nr:HET-domain-containing protein [Hyaloscypha bicolor E]PMD54792.1 HET-domain-containing protein [Hyaloscypha bicolor E]
MSDYRYLRLLEPGSDLRLIQILPGDEGEDLGCTIRTYDNLKTPPYQALSYTWGDPEAKVRITLNGKRSFVTPNLESALRSIRWKRGVLPSMQEHFWIDAVCINQGDAEERDEQVRRMKSMYQDADGVVRGL